MEDRRLERGHAGEDAAAAHLAAAGLDVLERNVRSRLGELDLVCRDGDVWVFVEVKARGPGWGDPAGAAVTVAKRRRLTLLARHYLKWRGLGEPRCRFDVVDVTLAPGGDVAAIRHLRGAFEGEAW
jgi:putative endonuclease